MLHLSKIQKEAERLLPSVLSLVKHSANSLLEQAITVGPIGGCHETFSPIYLYNHCRASCPYCGFGSDNHGKRVILSSKEMNHEVQAVRDMGCEAIYILGGTLVKYLDPQEEDRLSRQAKIAKKGLVAVCSAGLFPILEMSPFSRHEFQILNQEILSIRSTGGRFVLFQETYDVELYNQLHNSTTQEFKGKPDERLKQVELAIEAGWPEVGVGALLGLSSNVWFETTCVLTHAFALRKLGVQKVTISVPRIKTFAGKSFPTKCSDETFIKIVAVFSLLGRAVDNGIKVVITGRETKELRDLLAPCTDIWGISGSTVPGGYSKISENFLSQFDLADHRTLTEIRADHALKF